MYCLTDIKKALVENWLLLMGLLLLGYTFANEYQRRQSRRYSRYRNRRGNWQPKSVQPSLSPTARRLWLHRFSLRLFAP